MVAFLCCLKKDKNWGLDLFVDCYLLFCCISFGDRSADRFVESLQSLILWDFCAQSGLDRVVTAKNSKSTIFSGVGQPADRN